MEIKPAHARHSRRTLPHASRGRPRRAPPTPVHRPPARTPGCLSLWFRKRQRLCCVLEHVFCGCGERRLLRGCVLRVEVYADVVESCSSYHGENGKESRASALLVLKELLERQTEQMMHGHIMRRKIQSKTRIRTKNESNTHPQSSPR